MEKTIKRYHGYFESSSGKTAEFISFHKLFKREFSALLNSIGASDPEFSNGHFYVFGFFRLNGQAWYFNTGDVRFKLSPTLLIRTARDYKDYTGGQNREVYYNENFVQQFKNIVTGGVKMR